MNKHSSLIGDTVKLIREKTGDRLSSIHLEDVRIGLLYSGVKLSSQHGGVAYTFLEDVLQQAHSMCISRKSFRGLNLSDALKLSFSQNFIDVLVGVASLNAASQFIFDEVGGYEFSDVDVLDLVRENDEVVMVGYFKPLVPKVRKKARKLTIVEKKKFPIDEIQPHHAIEDVVPEADVVIATGSTLVNKTIDRVLKLSSAREFVLLGPTASIIPDAFFEKGGTAMMGARMRDADKMLQVVSEVGGTKRLLAECPKNLQFTKEEGKVMFFLLKNVNLDFCKSDLFSLSSIIVILLIFFRSSQNLCHPIDVLSVIQKIASNLSLNLFLYFSSSSSFVFYELGFSMDKEYQFSE